VVVGRAGRRYDARGGGVSSGGGTFFCRTVDLWLDNLDPQSLSFLRAAVMMGSGFWALQLRCFVRVNGVMARVIDTKFTCDFGGGANGAAADAAATNDDKGKEASKGQRADGLIIVRREQTWREGPWSLMVGGGGDGGGLRRHVDFGGFADRVAAERLPLLRLPVVDHLVLAARAPPQKIMEQRAGPVPSLLWKRQLRCDVLAVGPPPNAPDTGEDAGGSDPADRQIACGVGMIVVSSDDGAVVEAINVFGACLPLETAADLSAVAPSAGRLWRRCVANGSSILALALSPPSKGRPPMLALGDDCGCVNLWRLSTGEPVARVHVATRALSGASCISVDGSSTEPRASAPGGSARAWVESLCWSADGAHIASAAGRAITVTAVSLGAVPASASTEGDAQSVAAVALGASAIPREGCIELGSVSAIARVPSAGSQKEGAHGGGGGGGACFAASGYGGVRLVQAAAISQQAAGSVLTGPAVHSADVLEIGATATLSLAIAPDGSTVAVGCLDKRLRLFQLAATTEAGGTPGTAGRQQQQQQQQDEGTRDWVGFDGPVASVQWSATGRWLAAAGGSALLVLPRALRRGHPPIRCVLPHRPAAAATPVSTAVAPLN
jgi:hypothetical protein